MNKKVVLITGCSSGFGYLSALKFARNGWQVVASMHSLKSAGVDDLRKQAKQEGLLIEIIEIDVTVTSQIDKAIKKIVDKFGQIDVLVNNAGYGQIGPLETFSDEEIHQQFDVNVFGVLRMSRAVLPHMRARKSGMIINISSFYGKLTTGLSGLYAATKHAVEAITETQRFEVERFGIKVTMIEPGMFSTNFAKNVNFAKEYKKPDSPYQGLRNPMDKSKETGGIMSRLAAKVSDPQVVVDRIFAVANKKNPRLRYKAGITAVLFVWVRKLLPDRAWMWLLHKASSW